MRRIIVLGLIALCFANTSFAQRRSRNVVRKIIQLTKPETKGKMTFEEALSQLKNTYRFTGQAIDRSAISQLAWAGLGNRVTPEMIGTAGVPQPLQSVLPTQLFIMTNEGVFFYQPLNNSLEQVLEGDARSALAVSTGMPESVASAGCVILIASSSQAAPRGAGGGTRGARLDSRTASSLLLEAGHIAQNIQLQAVCLGQDLGSVAVGDFDSRAAGRICGLPRDVSVLYMVCVGYVTEQDRQGTSVSPVVASSKKVAIIVPAVGFQDEEFYTTLNILGAAQIQTVVASNRVGLIRGVNQSAAPYEVRVLANQLRAADFDGIIVIGGPGASAFIGDQPVTALIRDAFDKRKLIGATSMGTAVLASTGILKGIKVTGLPSESVNISNAGAIFTGELVENDSRVITCIGPAGAVKFAREFADTLLGR